MVEATSPKAISTRVTLPSLPKLLVTLDSSESLLSYSSGSGLVYLIPIRLKIMSNTTLLATRSSSRLTSPKHPEQLIAL